MNARTDYNAQADAFLQEHGLRFRATQATKNTCPPFCDGEHHHGRKHTITLSKPGNGRLSFAFWNSQNEVQKGEPIRPYSVLACISSDAYCPETFEDFCSEYGYDEDSRKAWATFKRCDAFRQRLQRFFTEDELTALAEIQ